MWIDSINEAIGSNNNESKFQIILIGNKSDLIGQNGLKREVEEEEAKEFCVKHNLLWGGECSAKTFSQDKFREIFKDFIIKMQKKVGDNFKKEEDILKKNKKNKKKRCC